MSAPMANEDVLERARNFDRELSEADKQRRMVDLGALHLIHALAAELREAREDTRRLDALWDRLQGGPYFVVRLDSADALNRENVERFRGMGIIRLLDADAAMKTPGGEDGA